MVIAVGWTTSITPDVRESIYSSIREHIPDFDKSLYPIEDEIHSGAMYNKSCRGGLSDVQRSEGEMDTWFKKKGEVEITLRHFYVVREPRLIMCGGMMAKPFFVFLSNSNGVSTTVHKKQANAGHFGRPLDITIKAKARSYRF